MGSGNEPLEYALPHSKEIRRRGWLSTSICISLVSLIISFGWEDIRFAFPRPGPHGNPDSNIDVRLHMWIWQYTVFTGHFLLWDLWVWLLPVIATAIIVFDRIAERRWNSRLVTQLANDDRIVCHQPRWLVIWSIPAAIFAWVAPIIAVIIFFCRLYVD
jgi:hypothetical protein